MNCTVCCMYVTIYMHCDYVVFIYLLYLFQGMKEDHDQS